MGTALLVHLEKGGTIENFEHGDAESASTYLEQEGVAVAVQQGGQGVIGKMLNRFGYGTNQGKARAYLLEALQKGALKVTEGRAEISEFGERQRRGVGAGVRARAAVRQLEATKGKQLDEGIDAVKLEPTEVVSGAFPTTLEARKLEEKKAKKIGVAPPPEAMEARKIDVKAAAQAALQGKMKTDSPVDYLKRVAVNSKTELLAGISVRDFAIPKDEVGSVQAFKMPAMDVGYALRKTEDGYEVTGVYNREPNVVEIMQSIIAHAEGVVGGKVTIADLNAEETLKFKLHTEEDVIYSLEEMKEKLQKESKGKGARALGKKLSAVNLLPKQEYYDNQKKVEELENEIPEIAESKDKIKRYGILHRGLTSRLGAENKAASAAETRLSAAKDKLESLRKELWTDKMKGLDRKIVATRERLLQDNLGLSIVRNDDGSVSKKQHRNIVVQARLDTYAQSLLGLTEEKDAPETLEAVMANAIAEELIWAAEHDPEFGQNWYKDQIDRMWHWIGKVESTLADRNSEQGIHFSLLISLLSDGDKIQNNIRLM